MSEETDSAPAKADEPLDFDRAEFAAEADAAPQCAACKRPLGAQYFTINDATTCEDCHHLVSTQLKEGKSARAFMRAAGFGAVAALGGSIAWYAVAKITGMEIGLLAIAVGYIVGHAVRRGSRSPGGRRYQALAMLLTYMSITGSYVPLVLKTFAEHEAPGAGAAGSGSASPATATAPATAPSASAGLPNDPTSTAPQATAPAVGAVQIVLFVVVVFGVALIAPFLGGASNIIGLVLIAIALYEAWKLNKTVPLVLSGPLRTAKPRGG